MKLCFLTVTDSIHAKRWIKYFTDRGHEVHWITLGSFDIDLKNAILHPLKFKIKIAKAPLRIFSPINLLFNVISVKKLLKKINPDLLQLHTARPVVGLVGALSGFHPLIITPWGYDVLIEPKSKIKRPLIKFALKKADLITSDGEKTRETIVNLGVNPQKIKRICFGVDIKKFKPGLKDKNLKKQLKVAGSPIVISLRNLEPIYDLGTLIRAIPFVLKKIPEVKFIIVGNGSEKKDLINLAKSLNVFRVIRFLGLISNDKIFSYLNLADVYTSTSLSDSGLAASTAEAMACGLPVIITDSGDNKKWVKNGENGFTVPVKNPEVLAEKIIYLLKNEKVRLRFGKINREIIKEKNNYYKEMAKMENIYNELKAEN